MRSDEPLTDLSVCKRLRSYAPYFYQGQPLVPKVCEDAAGLIDELYSALSDLREHSTLSHATAARIDAVLAKARGEA